uniref:RING-type E3 ubiquitin transferase n=1 Tax=Ornithorhynchus anatinus TaxID=9258 RepID=A0A6I8P5V0_ORNAN
MPWIDWLSDDGMIEWGLRGAGPYPGVQPDKSLLCPLAEAHQFGNDVAVALLFSGTRPGRTVRVGRAQESGPRSASSRGSSGHRAVQVSRLGAGVAGPCRERADPPPLSPASPPFSVFSSFLAFLPLLLPTHALPLLRISPSPSPSAPHPSSPPHPFSPPPLHPLSSFLLHPLLPLRTSSSPSSSPPPSLPLLPLLSILLCPPSFPPLPYLLLSISPSLSILSLLSFPSLPSLFPFPLLMPSSPSSPSLPPPPYPLLSISPSLPSLPSFFLSPPPYPLLSTFLIPSLPPSLLIPSSPAPSPPPSFLSSPSLVPAHPPPSLSILSHLPLHPSSPPPTLSILSLPPIAPSLSIPSLSPPRPPPPGWCPPPGLGSAPLGPSPGRAARLLLLRLRPRPGDAAPDCPCGAMGSVLSGPEGGRPPAPPAPRAPVPPAPRASAPPVPPAPGPPHLPLSSFDCSVCLEVLHRPVRTRCGHVFCRSCIATSLRNNKWTCPYCRAYLPSEGVPAVDIVKKMKAAYQDCTECETPVCLSEMRAHIRNCNKYIEKYGPLQELGEIATRCVCPFCQRELDEDGLLDHCLTYHKSERRPVFCPLCRLLPAGDPSSFTGSLIRHLQIRHTLFYNDFLQVDLQMLAIETGAVSQAQACS